jgi:diguanylate cyclase (GGDEF)-like protein
MRKEFESELRERNQELATLYKISSAISRTIDLSELFNNILNTITELEALKVERKGGIFIVDGDRMILASHLGHSKSFLDMHIGMKVGDCLCGLAAKTGEIIVSNNVSNDRRHTITYPEVTPHGHIVIPLKVANRVLGVLYLYVPCNSVIDEKTMNTLIAIGNQLGIAINNSMLYEQTKMLSLHDSLTKVANRNLMDIELEKNFARAKRFKSPFSVIMLDLDNFKKYNDTFGHTAGDKLLIDTAKVLLNEIRAMDLVARYGGEEFLLILPDIPITKACEVAERIRKAVETTTGITVSLGVSAYQHGKTQKADDLIKKADEALYQAKQKGKNRVEISD